MNETNRAVTEADLHAFADDLLAPSERARVEAWLADHADEAGRVAAWQAQNAGIKALFEPYETSKEQDWRLVTEQRRADRALLRQRMSIAAAALLIFAAGGLAGHYIPIGADERPLQLAAIETLPGQAQSAYTIYASEVRHPVEVGADQEDHLAAWLGKRLDIGTLKVPDLKTAGFQLVGGRLLPVNGTPGAMFMYEDASGRRLTVLIGRNRKNETTSFRFASSGSLDTFYWIDGDLGYAVTGQISRDTLRQIAELCYKQFPTS